MAENLAHMGIKGTEDWFFGPISREQANTILLKEALGTYLMRCSSEPGSFALSVRDKTKANHYKITASRRQTQEGYKFRIGLLDFISIYHIIEYYKKNKLGDSTLVAPAPRLVYRAKFDFKPDSSDANAAQDISLRRNECVLFLDVLVADSGAEDANWWRVLKQNTGEMGFVPSSYLRQSNPAESEDCNKFAILRQLNSHVPFSAEVMRARNPNIFDASQLRLEVGDTVQVKQVTPEQPELWYGVNLRSHSEGIFPFNYVRPLSDPCRCSAVSSSGSAASCRGGNRTSQASGSALDEQAEPPAAEESLA